MDLDALYRVAPEDFVVERDALVAKLRKRGDEDQALRLKKLKRPTLPVWTLNQLAQRRRSDVRRLVEILDAIKGADAARMRELSEQRREITTRLLEAAQGILEETGHAATSSTLARIGSSLYATPDDDERERLLQGRLEAEIAGSGLEAFGLMSPIEDVPSADDRRKARAAEKQAKQLADAAQRAEAVAARLTEQAEEAAREAQRAADEAARARREAHDARKLAERAARETSRP